MSDLIFKDLSYKIVGLCFKAHNTIGPVCREKQYQDSFESFLKVNRISYQREKEISFLSNGNIVGGNRVDFLIENKIIVECKVKRFLTDDDIRQVLRYLKAGKYKLGLLINFRGRKVIVKRIVNSDLPTGIGIVQNNSNFISK